MTQRPLWLGLLIGLCAVRLIWQWWQWHPRVDKTQEWWMWVTLDVTTKLIPVLKVGPGRRRWRIGWGIG